MTLLWAGGAELQSTANTVEFSAIVTNAPAIETSIKRSGAAAWRISNAAAVEGFAQIHTAAQGKYFFQFYLYIVAAPTNSVIAIAMARQTGNNKISIRLTSGLALRLFNEEDSAQVGSDSSALSLNTWYRVAMMYDSTTLASTSVEARAYTDVAGAAAFWNPSGTIDITATPNRFGCFIPSSDATLDYIVDDCTINDTTATGGPFNWNTWPPENKLIILRPNGNGDNSAWTGSDGNSTDNYLLVDETPPDSTDYVQSNTSGQIDDYDMEATPAAIGASDTINAVLVGVYAAVADATSADPDIVLRIKASSGGTVDETASLDVNSVTYHAPAPLPANDNYSALGNSSNYEQPGGSTAWTKAALDTMQVGVREAVTDTHFARVAAMWAYVSFTPATGGTTYNQSPAGTLTSSGTAARQTNAPKAGALTSAGAVAKITSKAFAGTLTSAGAAVRLTAKALSGALTSSGALAAAKRAAVAIGGTLTSSGALVRQAGKAVSGALDSSGTLARMAGKSLAGALTSAGTVARLTTHSFAGTLTSAGELTRQTAKALSGALTSAGSLATQLTGGAVTYFQDLAGTLTSAGAVAKRAAKWYAGSLAPTGALLRRPAKALSGALASAGTVRRHTARLLAGTLFPVGALHRRIGKLLAGVLDFAGALTQLFHPAGPYSPAPSARRVRVDARDRLTEPTGAGERVVIVEREHR